MVYAKSPSLTRCFLLSDVMTSDFVIKCCDMRCCVSVITNHVPMKEYILNLSWWCDLLTSQEGIHAESRECDHCDQNTTCAPQRKYWPRMQCYNPVLPIVTLFSQTKDAQESAQARGGTLFHNATCHKGRSSIISNTGGIGEANKEWNMICAIQHLHLEPFPQEAAGQGGKGGNHVGFKIKQDHEWNEQEW